MDVLYLFASWNLADVCQIRKTNNTLIDSLQVTSANGQFALQKIKNKNKNNKSLNCCFIQYIHGQLGSSWRWPINASYCFPFALWSFISHNKSLVLFLCQISYGLSKLLYYLAHSPYGSVIVNDFRRQQFILVDGDIKLTDLDDIGFTERECRTDYNCQQYYSSANLTLRLVKCVYFEYYSNIFWSSVVIYWYTSAGPNFWNFWL